MTAASNVRIAYTRAAIGSMDHTPSGLRNVAPTDFTPRNRLPLVMTTRAQQLATFVVYPSPLQSLCDAPSTYLDAHGRRLPGAGFLRLVPASWSETRGVVGEWGRRIAVAQRSGEHWFVGAIGDDQSRTVVLPLTFLGEERWRVRALIDDTRPTKSRRKAAWCAPSVSEPPGAITLANTSPATPPTISPVVPSFRRQENRPLRPR